MAQTSLKTLLNMVLKLMQFMVISHKVPDNKRLMIFKRELVLLQRYLTRELTLMIYPTLLTLIFQKVLFVHRIGRPEEEGTYIL